MTPSSPRSVPLSAAVIAGGANSRMGSPKGLLEIAGKPLLTRVVDTLSVISQDLICVTCRPDEYPFEYQRLRFVPDYRGVPQGPLSGIMGALAATRHNLCVAVAVDMPFLSAELLRHLAQLADGFDVVLPIIESDRPECLHAVYRKTCLAPGTEALNSGRRKVTSFFDTVRVRRVTAAELRAIDPELTSFENINTPLDLALALSPQQREQNVVAGSEYPRRNTNRPESATARRHRRP